MSTMGRPHLEDMIAFPRLPTKEPKKKTCTLSCIARYSCICLGKSIISNFGCLFHDPCTGTLLCGGICGRLKVYEVAVWQCFATPLKKGYKKNSHTTGAKKKLILSRLNHKSFTPDAHCIFTPETCTSCTRKHLITSLTFYINLYNNCIKNLCDSFCNLNQYEEPL